MDCLTYEINTIEWKQLTVYKTNFHDNIILPCFRGLVVERVCQLLFLVPALEENSEEYEVGNRQHSTAHQTYGCTIIIIIIMWFICWPKKTSCIVYPASICQNYSFIKTFFLATQICVINMYYIRVQVFVIEMARPLWLYT